MSSGDSNGEAGQDQTLSADAPTHGSAARLRRLRRPLPLRPIVRKLVSPFWRDIRDSAKNAVVHLATAAPGPSQVVLGHESSQLLADGGADELVHGHAFSLGELSQATLDGVRKTDTERAHLDSNARQKGT